MEIQGFPNYLIFRNGSILSKGCLANGKPPKFIKPYMRGNYLSYMLCNDKKQKNKNIHRLIAIHFIPNPNNLPLVDHKNRIKTDNRIENLRWVSSSDNNQNVGKRIDNKTGHKNICYRENKDRYIFQKIIDGKKTYKTFKTLDEAIQFKNII